jgi:phosphomevalonate kinase
VRDGGVQDRPAWPAGLHYRYFFSGKSASTSDAIARTAAIPDSDAILLGLVASAGDAAIAMASGNVDDAISAIGAYSRALKSFDETHRLGIFAAGHERIMRHATDIGAVYKPCGAGGGDIGIALDTDQGRLDALTEKAAGEGFVLLDLQMDNDGVRQETLAGL